MKKKTEKSESIFKKKGFYTTLYSCVGVVMILAAVISFYNFNTIMPPSVELSPTEAPAVDFSLMEQTGSNVARSYLTPTDREKVSVNESVNQTDMSYEQEYEYYNDSYSQQQETSQAEKPSVTENTTNTKNETNNSVNVNKSEQAPESSSTVVANNYDPSRSIFNQSDKGIPTHLASADSVADSQTFEELAEPVFEHYVENDKMQWPVLGEIVMDYNITSGVYDQTLDQYRMNDNICIAAPVGTQVKASTDGVVLSVEKTFSDGNKIVIDNGNGWTTTYSQLQDSVLVNEGDVVTAGQVIGGVGSPAIYAVLMGNHLNFKVEKDGIDIDPKTILDQQ